MDIDFSRGARLCKVMADETRARIVHILSCGELCACDLLEYFNISQPTLSHHLGLLVEAGLILARSEGKWTHYSVHKEAFAFLERYLKDVSRKSDACLCTKAKRSCT